MGTDDTQLLHRTTFVPSPEIALSKASTLGISWGKYVLKKLVGQTLGEKNQYKIQELQEDSEASLLFKAYDTGFEAYAPPGRPVNISVFKSEYGWSTHTIKTIIAHEHPHIWNLLDGGICTYEGQKVHYLVMQPFEALTLSDRLGTGDLTLDEVKNILAQVCDALDYAHNQGLVHFRLKPDRIWFDAWGNTRLAACDFVPFFQASDGTITIGNHIVSDSEFGRHSAERQISAFSDIGSLGIWLSKCASMPMPKPRWRWAIYAVSILVLIIFVIWATLQTARPLQSIFPQAVADETDSPTAPASQTIIPTPQSSPTPTRTPTVTRASALLLSSTPTHTPTAVIPPSLTPALTPFVVAKGELLCIYNRPGIDSEMRGEVNSSVQLILYGCWRDGPWWQVEYAGQKSWVKADDAKASIDDPCILLTIVPSPTPTSTFTPMPTETPTLPVLAPELQNATFENVTRNHIPGWQIWVDNDCPENRSCDYVAPTFKQADDLVREIIGDTLQIDAAGFLKFRAGVLQTIPLLPGTVLRSEVDARGFSSDKGNRIEVKVGIDPEGRNDCRYAQWGLPQKIRQEDEIVQLFSPEVIVGDTGKVTVCLYAETLYASQSNAAYFDNARLIVNSE